MVELDPIFKDEVVIDQERVKEVEVPGQKIYKQDYIQPVLSQEFINLSVKDGEDKVFNYVPENLEAQVTESKKVLEKDVRGSKIYKQQIVYPKITNEHVQLKFKNSGNEYYTEEPQYKEAKVNKKSEKKYSTVYHKVPEYHDVNVRVPVVHNIPVYKDVPVYVEMPMESEESY